VSAAALVYRPARRRRIVMFRAVRLGPLALLAFLWLFWLEAWLFLEIGRRLGLLPVLAWILVSFVLGALLIRMEGLRILFQMHMQLQRGVVPAREMLGALAVVLGGLLLMLPGTVTDALGLLLLFPPTRALLWLCFGRSLARWAGLNEEQGRRDASAPPRRPSEETIEVTAERLGEG
jgi:UPF0716 protein FxsA